MRHFPRLGPANLALVSLYFAPVWGIDAVRALMSPYGGFEDRAHAAAATYFRQLFDLGLDGLMRSSNALAGIKLIIAAGFVAYLIEFFRSIAVGREPNRETIDIVLTLAVGAIAIWGLPAIVQDDPGLIRLYATQLLLVAGAVFLILVERQVEQSAPALRTAEPAPQVEQKAVPPVQTDLGRMAVAVQALRARRGGEGAAAR